MLTPMLADVSVEVAKAATHNLTVGLAALGAALGVGFIGMKASSRLPQVLMSVVMSRADEASANLPRAFSENC